MGRIFERSVETIAVQRSNAAYIQKRKKGAPRLKSLPSPDVYG